MFSMRCMLFLKFKLMYEVRVNCGSFKILSF
jgi:hypothetical protein